MPKSPNSPHLYTPHLYSPRKGARRIRERESDGESPTKSTSGNNEGSKRYLWYKELNVPCGYTSTSVFIVPFGRMWVRGRPVCERNPPESESESWTAWTWSPVKTSSWVFLRLPVCGYGIKLDVSTLQAVMGRAVIQSVRLLQKNEMRRLCGVFKFPIGCKVRISGQCLIG